MSETSRTSVLSIIDSESDNADGELASPCLDV